MSTLLDEAIRTEATGAETTTAAAKRLRRTMAAVRVSIRWFGVRKSLSAQQKAQAADTFGAEEAFLSATKKLIDTQHPAFKAVTQVRNRAVQYWRGLSLPYPEAGLRLIRQNAIEEFSDRMRQFQEDLAEAVEALDHRYLELKAAARQKLGHLFNPADYPDSLRGLFALEFDFPSIEPPSYLQHLNPQLYEEECRRIQGRFDEAVQLAEQAFLGELSKLVSHLTERLTGATDGRPKVFRDSAVENFTTFFERFRQLNVRSSEELDRLVAEAQRVVRGVDPQDLRENGRLRQHVANELTRVQDVVDDLLVDRPRRNILRRPR
jgi:hypothetical protein